MGFFLTGGTALSEFYLHHRESDDLDFFRRGPDLEPHERDRIESMLATLESKVVSRVGTAMWFQEEAGTGHTLKLDFCRDAGARMAPPTIAGRVVVDSLEDIAVNKVVAIRSRSPSDVKDYVDLHFIIKETRFTLNHLLARAREKDADFEHEDAPLQFAVKLLDIETDTALAAMFPRLRMRRALKLEEMRDLLVPLARRIVTSLRPSGGRP